MPRNPEFFRSFPLPAQMSTFPKYCMEVQEADDLFKFNYYDTTPEGSNCPRYAQFFGQMGASCSMFMCGEYRA